MFRIVTSLILSIIVRSLYVIAQDDLIIQLPDGKIRGHVLQSYNNNPYYAFQEIPYAAPPIGADRFKEPQSPEPWTEIRNATTNTKQCVQFRSSSTSLDSEDCLFLNVYTPQKPGITELLPVYFYIHGGAFVAGTGNFDRCNPARFMDYDIIVVTINYRLGALGFISTDDDVIPGNLGLKDQAFALKWVNKNIHLFGGDPEKVTIGGQSAGAFAVGYQLLGIGNSGLFRGAIQESGSSISQLGYSAKAKVNVLNLARAIDPNFQSNRSEDLLNLLRKVSVQDLINGNLHITPADDGSGGYVVPLTWLPVIESSDAKNPFILSPMLESFMNGDFNQVPLILGFNSEESLSFMAQSEGDYAAAYDNDSTLLVDSRLNVADENITVLGEEIKEMYTNSNFTKDKAALVKLSSDAAFTTSMIRQAEVSSKYVTTYLYQFSYMGLDSVFGELHHRVPGAEGVAHGEEVRYLWDGVPPESNSDAITMNRLLLLWTNFIKYLNPTPILHATLNNVTWHKFQDIDIPYLNINETLAMQFNPRYYFQSKGLLLEYVRPPYTVF